MNYEQAIAFVDWKIQMEQDVEQFKLVQQYVIAQNMIERHRDEAQLYSWQKPQELVPLEP